MMQVIIEFSVALLPMLIFLLIMWYLDTFQLIKKEFLLSTVVIGCITAGLATLVNDFITINYDSGNSASLGYSIFEELNILGNKITNIHIKDRLLNGFSVELGKGNANLKFLKKFIIENNYNGVITFQAYRDTEGISIFKKQYQYFLDLKI